MYHHLALWLTNQENPRTQTEYEDSYTFKIFLFEFMNFYSSLIYIAFFKVSFKFARLGDNYVYMHTDKLHTGGKGASALEWRHRSPVESISR